MPPEALTTRDALELIEEREGLVEALVKIMGGYGEPVSADIARAALKAAGEAQ